MLVLAWLCFIFGLINLLIRTAPDVIDPEGTAFLLILWASGATIALIMNCIVQ